MVEKPMTERELKRMMKQIERMTPEQRKQGAMMGIALLTALTIVQKVPMLKKMVATDEA